MANLNDGLGILALVQSYDTKAINKAEKEILAQINNMVGDINSSFDKVGIDKNAFNKLIEQLKSLPKELRQKTQGISFDFLNDLINADGAEEKIDEALRMFSNKIDAFSNLRSKINNDEIVIKTDSKQLDELIKKEERLLELEKELNSWQNKETRTKGRTKKSITTDISDIEGQIKNDISNLNISGGQIGIDVDNKELEKLEKGIKSTEEALKSARKEADLYGKSLADLKKEIEVAYNKSVNKDTNANAQVYRKAVQNYIKAGGSQKDLDQNYIDWYKMSGLNWEKDFIPLDKIKSDAEAVQQEVQKLESRLDSLKKKRDELLKGSKDTSETKDTIGSVIDEQKLKEQNDEMEKIKAHLAETETQLNQINQKYEDQNNLVAELENKLKEVTSVNDKNIVDAEEFKTLSSQLDDAKKKVNELETELKQTKEVLKLLQDNVGSASGEVISKNSINNAEAVINNLKNRIKELETSMSSGEQQAKELADALAKLQQEKTNLSEQLSQQKQLNAEQEKQVSNYQIVKAELALLQGEYKELTASIKEMENTQRQYMSLLDNFGNIEAFNKAIKNISYNEGQNTPEGFINFDYLEKAKQKLEETGNAYEKTVKAAVYYNRYLQKGGTEKIFSSDGKDISDYLKSVYKEMSVLADSKTGLISEESIINIVRQYANELIIARKEQEEDRKLIAQKNKELEKSLAIEKNISNTRNQRNVDDEQISVKDTKSKQTVVSNNTKNKISREAFIEKLSKEQEKRINDELINTEQQAIKTNSAVENIGENVSGQDKLQSELKDTKTEIQEIGNETQQSEEKVKSLGNSLNVGDVGKNDEGTGIKGKEEQPLGFNGDSDKQQKDQSSIASEQEALKKLETAINSVKEAINLKTNAIEEEEEQMGTSINAEIDKLKELENALTTLKSQFVNGLSGIFKNPDGGSIFNLEQDVNLKLTVDADKFKSDAERLLAFVDVDKEVELKVGELDSNNQVIEDIKEQIEATNENVDLSDSYNSNQFNELLSKDFSTKGKKDATSQLREAYNEFKQYYDDLDKLNTVEGQKAAYNYYKAYEEAIKQRISETNLNKYSTDDVKLSYYKQDLYDEEIDYSNLNDKINIAERSIKLFSEVQNELGNIKIDDSIAEDVSKLAYNLNELEKIKSDLDNNVGRVSFDDDFNAEYSIENTKKEYEELSEIVSYFEVVLKSEISYAKEFGDTLTQSAQKAESAIADVNDELNKSQQQIQSNKGKTRSQDQDSEKKKTNDNSLSIQLQPEINDEEFLKTLNAIRNKVNPFKLDLDIDNWITVINNKLTEISGKKVKLDLDADLLSSNNTNNNTSSQEARHAKEVAEAQKKYEKQLLAEKKQREKEYTAWWTNELNNRDQIQKQLQAEEERNQKELQKQLEREQAESNKAQIQKYKDFIKEDDSEKTIKQSQEYAKLESVVEQYGEIRKNIAKNNGKATDEEIAKLNELEDKINSISKNISEQGLYSSGKDKSIAKTLLSYDDRDEKIRQQSSINSVDNSNNLKRVNQLLEEQREIQRQINALQNKEQSDGLSTGDQEVLNSLSRNYLDIQERINNELDKQYPKTKRITDVLSKITTNNVDFENIRTLNFDDDINFDKSVENVNKFGAEIDNIRNKLEDLSNANTNAIFQGEFQNASNNISELTNEFLNSKLQLSDFNKYSKETEKILNNLEKKENVAGIFEAGNLQAAQNAMKTYAISIDAVDASTIKWNSNGQKLTATFKDANGELRELILNARLADGQFDQTFGKPVKQVSTWSKFIDELGVKFRNLGTYLLSFVGFYEVWGAIRQGVTYVRELDTALTEMRKVSDETVSSLKEFQQESFNVAESVGSTAKEIQNSTAEWLKLGYAMEDASKLAETTAIYKAVGDNIDIEEATASMISTLEGFQLEAEDATSIINKFNEVSNHFAIDSKGIGDALQRSAASFSAANTGLSESIALITATMKIKWLNIWKHILRIYLIAGKSLKLYTTIIKKLDYES